MAGPLDDAINDLTQPLTPAQQNAPSAAAVPQKGPLDDAIADLTPKAMAPIVGASGETPSFSMSPPAVAQAQPPKQEPSFWANTGTGLARAAGAVAGLPHTLADLYTGVAGDQGGLASLVQQYTPTTQQATNIVFNDANALANGKPSDALYQNPDTITGPIQPYQPQSLLGRAYQNAIEGAPIAVLGPGGATALATREAMNATGSLGAEAARAAFPNHPIVAPLVGALAAGSLPMAATTAGNNIWNVGTRLAGTQGAVEREALRQFGLQPAFHMPLSDIDDTLSNSGSAYWTPKRISAASELNKRQAVNQMMNNGTVPAPPPQPQGLLSRVLSSDAGPYAIGSIVGEPLGNLVGHAISHVTGLPSQLTDLAFGSVGAGMGLLGAYGLKPYLQGRATVFNQDVADMLKNQQSKLWQQYNQPQPGLLSPYATGLLAPAMTSQQ